MPFAKEQPHSEISERWFRRIRWRNTCSRAKSLRHLIRDSRVDMLYQMYQQRRQKRQGDPVRLCGHRSDAVLPTWDYLGCKSRFPSGLSAPSGATWR